VCAEGSFMIKLEKFGFSTVLALVAAGVIMSVVAAAPRAVTRVYDGTHVMDLPVAGINGQYVIVRIRGNLNFDQPYCHFSNPLRIGTELKLVSSQSAIVDMPSSATLISLDFETENSGFIRLSCSFPGPAIDEITVADLKNVLGAGIGFYYLREF